MTRRFTSAAECLRRFRPVGDPKLVLAQAAGIAVFASVQFLGTEWLKLNVFSQAAAAVAAMFFGTGYTGSAGGYVLMHADLEVRVTALCSGFDFFSLLYAALCGIALRYSPRPLRQCVLLLPLSFAVAVGANAARVICAVHARLLSDLLPAMSANAAHLAVGVLVFVFVLAASCQLARIAYAKS